jgi:hypothetical protein
LATAINDGSGAAASVTYGGVAAAIASRVLRSTNDENRSRYGSVDPVPRLEDRPWVSIA